MSQPTLDELMAVIQERSRANEYALQLKRIEDSLFNECEQLGYLSVIRKRPPTAGSIREKPRRRETQLELSNVPTWRETLNSQ